LLHYTLVDPEGNADKELCTLRGEVRSGRVYALDYGPEISAGARGKLTIEHLD
jgi:hypothetical protein